MSQHKFAILSHKFENGRIRVLTNYKARPEFVYPADKFATKEELMIEIDKSIQNSEKRSTKTQARINSLEAELNG